jgi:hypothetical protein
MRVTLNPVLDMRTMEWVSNDGVYEYSGPILSCLGGASSGDKENLKSQRTFFDDLKTQTNETFNQSQTMLDQLNKGWQAITSQGINQYGYSSAEDALIRSSIENVGATNTANTVAAQQLREQQQTGGAEVAPTGAQQTLEEQARIEGGQSTAEQLTQEKLAGYATGRENYLAAAKGEQDVANTETGLAESQSKSAVSEAGNVNQAQQVVDTANQNSLLNKALGGVINAGLGLATGGVSTALGFGVKPPTAAPPVSSASAAASY